MDSKEDIETLIEKIRSGEIYGEIQTKYQENLNERKSKNKRDPNIEELQKKIQKKEEEITKLLGEIIKLKNELSQSIEKELES
jgi:nitrate reductase beta subunit